MNETKKRIHSLIDCIQGVLGYFELGDYAMAEMQAHQCIHQMNNLAEEFKTLKRKDAQ